MLIRDAIARCRATGTHFFDKEAMEFFDTRIHGNKILAGGFFVTSSRFPGQPRRYHLRRFECGPALVETIEEFRSLEAAKKAAKKASRRGTRTRTKAGKARKARKARKAGTQASTPRCPVGTEVQTLIFPKAGKWTSCKARKWAKQHGFSSNKVDETDSSFRLRQYDPDRFTRLRTIGFGDSGIKAVVGCPK